MNKIRSLYRPLQPSIHYAETAGVSYFEQAPDPLLEDFIYCYWQLKTDRQLDQPFTYRVVSDGCIDILLELNKVEDSFITGFSFSAIEYDLGQEFNYLGIRFIPTGFPSLYDISAATLFEQFLPLRDILPKEAKFLADQFHAAQSFAEMTSLLDDYFKHEFLQRQANIKIDQRLLAAIDLIMRSSGNIELKTLDVGLSPRQLRRLFHFYYGQTPKVFAKIVRFQHFLQAKPSNESLEQNRVFYDIGYYDQAHFIKEFKKFYGLTPTKVFNK